MPDGAEGPPLAAPDVPVPAPELADDPDAPPLAAAPPAPPPAPPPPPPPPCARTGAATAKDSAAVRRSDFRFMTFSSVKKVNDAEMTMVPLRSVIQVTAPGFPRAAASYGLSGSPFLEFEVHRPGRISRLPAEYPYRHGRTRRDDDAVPFVHRELPDVAFGRPNRMRINVLVAGLCATQNASVQNGAGGSLVDGRVHVDGGHRGNLQRDEKTSDAPLGCCGMSSIT